jgi:hypothetical protein
MTPEEAAEECLDQLVGSIYDIYDYMDKDDIREMFTNIIKNVQTKALREAREALEWVAREVWEGYSVDGFDWQDEMEERGILVKVPSTKEFIDEWGEDAQMYALAWSPLAND